RIDLRLTVASLAKDLHRVLAELRREAWRDLFDAVEPERACHGERSARARVVEGHQGATGDHLRIVPRVVHGADLAEGEAVTIQDFSPSRPRPRSEDLVQEGHEGARVGAPGGRGGEARVLAEVGPLDRPEEVGPVTVVV